VLYLFQHQPCTVQLIILAALLAQETLLEILSPGLPANQWTLEVTRWFTTSLAKMQSSVVEYASNEDPGPYGYIITPENFHEPPAKRDQLTQQCKTQRIQSSSKVQSFSMLGLGIVSGTAVLLILVSLSLESCIKLVERKSTAIHRGVARQADDKLHLLRMALGDQGEVGLHWGIGTLDVPVAGIRAEIEGPSMGAEGLASYAHKLWDQSRQSESEVSATLLLAGVQRSMSAP
jgi:hypothetical protein